MHSHLAAARAEHDTVVCDVDVLNALLRGEVAAVETYDQVIAKFDGQPQAVELQHIRDEHTETAAVLRERVRHFGGDPSEGSGIWGKLTAAITGTAKIFGPTAALGTLKQGEEYGIGQYENALTDPDIDTDDKDLIRYRLLPRCHNHVSNLDRMIEVAKK
jgi:demethoxyubiquinone hydroxylase (CLK1/Coq7/Cat5 family)